MWRNDECDDTSRDEESLDDYPLLDMNLCRLEGDHVSLLNVNDMEDRKPPAKSPPQNERAAAIVAFDKHEVLFTIDEETAIRPVY